MKAQQVLVLPGWQGNASSHWQRQWAKTYGYQIIEQHDWIKPLRGDWLARLDDVIADIDGAIYLLAHCIGCFQVASWAAISKQAGKVKGAMLVAPADVEAKPLCEILSSWKPIALAPLPFKSLLISSENDPFCSTERAKIFANSWGSNWIKLDAKGHLNADSNLGAWPEGHAFLTELMKVKEHGH